MATSTGLSEMLSGRAKAGAAEQANGGGADNAEAGGFLATLTPQQKEALLAFKGPDIAGRSPTAEELRPADPA